MAALTPRDGPAATNPAVGAANSSSSDSEDTSDDEGGGGGNDAALAAGSAAALKEWLPLAANASMFAVQRSLHKTKHDLRNRLHSIHYDAGFVGAASSQHFPRFASFANLRQGAWYLDPALRASSGGGTCCFKSSDGHAGQWCFNPRRLNKHVALAAALRGGVVVVDSTRGGKRLPDALSKTVPLWCAVLNTALARHRARAAASAGTPEPEPEPELEQGLEAASAGSREQRLQRLDTQWDCAVHCAPGVPPSEAAQISDRIEGWADDLEASGGGLTSSAIDLARLSAYLKKPLRPLWFGADRGVEGIPAGYEETLITEVDFTPVVCLIASETEHPKRGDFVYGQGAADDEEGWAEGLAAAQWWVGKQSILAEETLEGCQVAAKAVRETPLVAAVAAEGEGGGFTEICDGDGKGLGVAVGRWEAGAAPAVWRSFGAVINCGGAEHPGLAAAKEPASDGADGPAVDEAVTEAAAGPGGIAGQGRYLWMDISSGGKQTAAAKGLTKSLPSALEFATRALQAKLDGRKMSLLLHCDETVRTQAIPNAAVFLEVSSDRSVVCSGRAVRGRGDGDTRALLSTACLPG